MAKHHPGKLLNSNREPSRPSKDEKRREEEEKEEGRVSLVCRSLAAEAVDWRMILLSPKQSKLSLLDYSTQLLINTEVFDCA